jgi:exodeoxyribonuclease V alpha subunit
MKVLEDIRARFGDKRADQSFVPGDKVIQIRNNYDMEIFNGEIGYVLERRKGDILVRFDDRVLSYEYDSQDQLQLAYAITVHKSQGSESPVIVMPVHRENEFMLQRNLVYTGITRGKDHVMLIGEQSALKKAARTDRSNDRYSLLAGNLVELARLSPAFAHLELKERDATPEIEDEGAPVVLENEGMGMFG